MTVRVLGDQATVGKRERKRRQGEESQQKGDKDGTAESTDTIVFMHFCEPCVCALLQV